MATVKRVWWKLLATAETGNKHSLQCKFILWQRLGGDKKRISKIKIYYTEKSILGWGEQKMSTQKSYVIKFLTVQKEFAHMPFKLITDIIPGWKMIPQNIFLLKYNVGEQLERWFRG